MLHPPSRSRACSRGVAALLALTLGLCTAPPASGQLALDPAGPHPGLGALLAAHDGAALVRGIATFAAPPSALEVGALRALGLAAQPMANLPLALVFGPVAAMEAAVATGAAGDIYPDERVELFDTASADAMGSALPRAAGFTGRGVTVGIVDSGCDASHPDLADHVAHNVKLYSGEYANVAPDGSNTIVVPFEMGPYQNSDLGGGHGTHVAGIVAADSTTAPAPPGEVPPRLGVAPDAELVCF